MGAHERRRSEEAEAVREERNTLRAAVDAAEARCQLALNQARLMEQE